PASDRGAEAPRPDAGGDRRGLRERRRRARPHPRPAGAGAGAGKHAREPVAAVRGARAKLAAGVALSIDDLATLTKETTMTGKATPQEMKAIFDPLAEKHFGAEERAALAQRSFDQAE